MMLRNGIIICMLIISLTACTSANKDYEFELIQAKVDNYTNSLDISSCLKKEAEVWGWSTEGGTVTGYFDDSSLKYFEGSLFGELQQTKYEVSYIDDSLIHISLTEITYDKPIYEKNFKITEEKVNEYIILDDNEFEYKPELKQLSKVSEELNLNNILTNFEELLK